MKRILMLLVVLAASATMAQGLLNRPGGLRRPGRLAQAPGLATRPAGEGGQAADPQGAAAGNAVAGNGSETTGVEPGGRSIEFNATPVDLVFKVYGELVDKTILKDPQVPSATITLQPRQGQELTDEDKIEAIETVLEMNGIHMEKYGEKFMRAIPRKEARKEGIPLLLDPEMELRESTRVVSMMIPFKNISIEDAQKILDQFKSAPGILIAIERTNSILITDTEANINRMREIAKTIDVATPVTEVVEYIQIKNANATEIKQVIDSIVEESMKEQEKNGKQPTGNVQQQNNNLMNRPFGGSRLLGRPGQQNNQPAEPAGNKSLLMSISEADRGMIRGKVVTIADERSNKILIITSATNMKFFKEVIAALDVETTPDTVVKVYRLKYAEAEDVSDMINDLIGNSVSSKGGNKSNQNQNARKGTSGSVTRNTQQQSRASVNQRSGDAKAGELNKDNTTVLADKRINGIVVMTDKELVPTLEQIIESMDIKLSQVLIETVIIEVGLGHGIESGIDWVQKGRQAGTKDATDKFGRNLKYLNKLTYQRDEDGEIVKDASGNPVVAGQKLTNQLWPEGDTPPEGYSLSDVIGKVGTVARGGLMNTYGSSASIGMAGGAQGGQEAYNLAGNLTQGVASNLLNKSFSFVFDSDQLGLSAILHAAQNDSRSKYIASPVIMTLDNKEAVVNATAMHYLLKGFTSSGNSYSTIAVPDYEQKELGIEIKTTPKINPNGTVMLTVEEKYTQLGAEEKIQYSASNGQSGAGGLQDVSVPTTVTREMSSDVLLENGQTVVFGGLTETTTTESETGIPILKDIPLIGKWLFSSVKESESRTELLVFMTPYVLDDAQAAQAEAIRRKKTMSDPRPWEDHGWSLSKLADPVAKREQLRRIQDEWKKQDEERQTKIALEKAKVERAKMLKEFSVEERNLWLKMHKDELDEEQQEELEKRMLDQDSQEALKKLAEKVRAQKLGDADRELKKMEDMTQAENERSKQDAEKAKAAEAATKPAAATPPAPTAAVPPPAVTPLDAAPKPVRNEAQDGLLDQLGAEKK